MRYKAELRKLMAQHAITCAEVAEIVEKSEQTVRAYRSNKNKRSIKKSDLQKLRIELKATK